LSGLTAPPQGKLNSSSFIGEFQGVPVSAHLLYQLIDIRHMESGFTWLLLLAAMLVGLFVWKRQFGAAVIASIALYSALAHARYMGVFVITVVTLGGPFLSDLFAANNDAASETPKPKPSPLRIPEPLPALATLVFCGVALLHVADFVSNRTYVVFNADWRFGAGESSWFPERAAAFIRREKLPGDIFEEYALGGFAAWSLGPQYPDFIDGRGDRLSPDLVAEQRQLYRSDPDSQLWQSEAARWNLNVLLVATSGFRGLQRMDPLAFCESASWRPVYMDEVSMVLVRNTPQNSRWVDRLRVDCRTQPLNPPAGASRPALYDFYLDSGALFLELHRDQESERALHQAATLYPEDPNAHLLLASLFQRQQRYGEAEQEYRVSIARNENSGALYSLGLLYAAEGRYQPAVEIIGRAADESTDPLDMFMTLGKLELGLNDPEKALLAFSQAEKHSPYRNGAESQVPELYAEIAEGNSEAYRLLGRWPEAIASEEKAARTTPLVANRWRRLADLYQANGQLGPAGQARQRAAELETPDHAASR